MSGYRDIGISGCDLRILADRDAEILGKGDVRIFESPEIGILGDLDPLTSGKRAREPLKIIVWGLALGSLPLKNADLWRT